MFVYRENRQRSIMEVTYAAASVSLVPIFYTLCTFETIRFTRDTRAPAMIFLYHSVQQLDLFLPNHFLKKLLLSKDRVR